MMFGGYYINAFDHVDKKNIDYSKIKEQLAIRPYDEVIAELVQLHNPFPDLAEYSKKFNIIDRNGYCMFPYKEDLPTVQIDKNLNIHKVENEAITNKEAYFLDYVRLSEEIMFDLLQDRQDFVKLSLVEAGVLDQLNFINNIIPSANLFPSFEYVVGTYFNGIGEQTNKPNVIKYFYDTGNIVVLLKVLGSEYNIESINNLGKIKAIPFAEVTSKRISCLREDIVSCVNKIDRDLGEIFQKIIEECGDSLISAANAKMIDFTRENTDELEHYRVKFASNRMINNIIAELKTRNETLNMSQRNEKELETKQRHLKIIKDYLRGSIDEKLFRNQPKNFNNKSHEFISHLSRMLALGRKDQNTTECAKNLYLYWINESVESRAVCNITSDLYDEAKKIIDHNEKISAILNDPANRDTFVDGLAECGVRYVDNNVFFCSDALEILSKRILNINLDLVIDHVPFNNALSKSINLVSGNDAMAQTIKKINSKFDLPKKFVITSLICEIVELIYHIEQIYEDTQPSNIGSVIVYCYVTRLAKNNPKYCSGLTNFKNKEYEIIKELDYVMLKENYDIDNVHQFASEFMFFAMNLFANMTEVDYKLAPDNNVANFSDCGETTIRNVLVLLLLYNGAPRDKLYEKLPPNALPGIVEFFKKYPRVVDHEISNPALRYDLVLLFNNQIKDEFMKKYDTFSISDLLNIENINDRTVVLDINTTPFILTNIFLIILGIDDKIDSEESYTQSFKKIFGNIEHAVTLSDNKEKMTLQFHKYILKTNPDHAHIGRVSSIKSALRRPSTTGSQVYINEILMSIIYGGQVPENKRTFVLTNYLIISCYNIFSPNYLVSSLYLYHDDDQDDNINILSASLVIYNIVNFDPPGNLLKYLEGFDISDVAEVYYKKFIGAENIYNDLIFADLIHSNLKSKSYRYKTREIKYMLTRIHPDKTYEYFALLFIVNKFYANAGEIINHIFAHFVNPKFGKEKVANFVSHFKPILKRYLKKNNISVTAFDMYINRKKMIPIWQSLYKDNGMISKINKMEMLHEYFLSMLFGKDELIRKLSSNIIDEDTQKQVTALIKNTLDYKQTEKAHPVNTMNYYIPKLAENGAPLKIIRILSQTN